MNTFTLRLLDATHMERFDDVVSFVGEDASGSFGVLAGHARMITSLGFGLARYRRADDAWEYLALPGALAYFTNNTLDISTRHYVRDPSYERISDALRTQLIDEELRLEDIKERLRRMEEEMLKRLWQLGREGDPWA